MTTLYQKHYKMLDNAGMYDHALTGLIINELMTADSRNEDFLFFLRPLKLEHEKARLATCFMDYKSATEYMEQHKMVSLPS